MKTQVIIPAAGSGERMKASAPKILLDLSGRPVIAHTLAAFEQCPAVDSVILVSSEGLIQALLSLIKKEGFLKVRSVITGGATRTQSVRNGLKALDKDTEIVLIHDGARPLVSGAVIEESIRSCEEHGAVVAAVPVKPTLKVVDPRTHVVSETLDRTLVWEIQTPQVFKRAIIERAYATDEEATDDAALVERTGVSVRIVQGEHRNIKVTTPEDLVIAEALIKG